MAGGTGLSVENLKAQLAELKQRLSVCRKKGADTKIAEIKIASVPAKISMIEATHDFRDVQKAAQMLDGGKAEIEEIESMIGAENAEASRQSSPKAQIGEILNNIGKLLIQGNLGAAKSEYARCVSLYSTLDTPAKKEIFNKLNEIRARISKE